MTRQRDRAGIRPAAEQPADDRAVWLDSEQLAAWRAFMNLSQRLPAALERQLQQDSQLSFLEYYVLALLSEEPERRMRISELAAKVNAELSRLSHLITRLEKRKLLRREPDPADGRFTLVILTRPGFSTLERAAPAHASQVRALFADALADSDLRALRSVAEKVLARIDD